MHYRPLTIKDKSQLIELLSLRPQVFNGYADDNYKEFIISKVDEFFTDRTYYLPGIWDDDKLLGTMIAKESIGSPSWVWGHWVRRLDASQKLYTAEGINILKQADVEIFNEMEINRKLNRFFVAYKIDIQENNTLKNAGMSDRLFNRMSKSNFRVAKYKFMTDCVVKAGTEAKYGYQRAILADRIWPFDVAIRMGVLFEA